jgi:hypothetical protein
MLLSSIRQIIITTLPGARRPRDVGFFLIATESSSRPALEPRLSRLAILVGVLKMRDLVN